VGVILFAIVFSTIAAIVVSVYAFTFTAKVLGQRHD
jgi:hypothetical protein